jgi:hypothetical protein
MDNSLFSEIHIALVNVASVDTRMSALGEIFRMSVMICEVELALKITKVREQYDPEEIRKLSPLGPCLQESSGSRNSKKYDIWLVTAKQDRLKF